jgi:predicted nucleotidyltransferase
LSDEGEAVSETVTTVAEAPVLEKLPPRVREALAAFQQALLAAFPGQIRRIILYGSYARGEAAPDSDVDVMVVVGWEEERLPDGFYRSMYGDPRWEKIVDLATDINLVFGIYISPMVLGQSRFEEWSPLMYSVRRDGVELWSLRD